MVTMILAHDQNYGIGKNGKLPWTVKEDLQHFKKCTYGKELIVGRKTATHLPPLKGRQVYVVSKSGLSIKDAIGFCTEPIVIGGAEVYHYCLDHNLVDEIIATEIFGVYDCDVFIRKDFFDNFKVVDVQTLGDHVVKWYKKK